MGDCLSRDSDASQTLRRYHAKAAVATAHEPLHEAKIDPLPSLHFRNVLGDALCPQRGLCFGTTPAVDAQAYRPGTGVALFGSPIRLMAHGLGWHLDELRDRKDVAIARSDYSCPAGEVPAGTIISVRITAEGIVNGEPRLAISEIWSLSDEVIDDWEPRPTPNGAPRLTRITVDGTPSVIVDLALAGSPLPGADATAARVVNSIAAVCAAEPGIYGALDLAVTPAMTASARR